MGEATSDFLVAKFNPYLAVSLGAVALIVSLIIQFSVNRYNAWAYWFSVTMVAVFGTMAADGLHIQFHVPYIASTIFYGVILIIVLMIWHKSEKTLSIHSINSRRREAFYWLTVLSTFALGTAAGDLTATTFGLGYFTAGLMFGGLIAIPAIVYLITKRHEVLWFWIAYILTRPLGASFSDWTSKPHTIGGLNWGDGHVSIGLTLIIAGFVSYLSISKVDATKKA